MRNLLNQLENGKRDPMNSARQAMRGPLPRRFYSNVSVAELGDEFGVELDRKPVRTPAKRKFVLPSRLAAELVCAEFRAQKENIDPTAMPVTRIVNTTIDGVIDNMQAVIEDIVKFSSADLTCYRAEEPHALAVRQAEAWDPLLDWMRDEFGANFILSQGVMPVAQPRVAIAAFANRLRRHARPFEIACVHTMTSLTGSAIAALAVAERFLSAGRAWELSNIDEDWNIEQWGEDAEAAARRETRRIEMIAAASLLDALEGEG